MTRTIVTFAAIACLLAACGETDTTVSEPETTAGEPTTEPSGKGPGEPQAGQNVSSENGTITYVDGLAGEATSSVPVRSGRVVHADETDVWAVDATGEIWRNSAIYENGGCVGPLHVSMSFNDHLSVSCRNGDDEVFTQVVDADGGLHADMVRPLFSEVNVTDEGNLVFCSDNTMTHQRGVDGGEALWAVDGVDCQSIPVIRDGYVSTTEVGKPAVPRVIDLESGQLSAEPEPEQHPDGYVWIGGNEQITMYRDDAASEIVAVDAAGEQLWRKAANDTIGRVYGMNDEYVWGLSGTRGGLNHAGYADLTTGEIIYVHNPAQFIVPSGDTFMMAGMDEVVRVQGNEIVDRVSVDGARFTLMGTEIIDENRRGAAPVIRGFIVHNESNEE